MKNFQFIIVRQGAEADLTGAQLIFSAECMGCGERITDAREANVVFPADRQAGEELPFAVLCPDCDLRRSRKEEDVPTRWLKLDEFYRVIGHSIGISG
jgi:hypothetical protein